jgi:hypothetical protein
MKNPPGMHGRRKSLSFHPTVDRKTPGAQPTDGGYGFINGNAITDGEFEANRRFRQHPTSCVFRAPDFRLVRAAHAGALSPALHHRQNATSNPTKNNSAKTAASLHREDIFS